MTKTAAVTKAGISAIEDVTENANLPAKVPTNAIELAQDEDFMSELALVAGEGTSRDVADNIVPFLLLAQDSTPECKKRESAYIEGLEPGMYFIRGTNILFGPGEAFLQPCYFEKYWVEWVPLKKGGGYVGRHAGLPKEARLVPNPENEEREIYVLPNGNEVVETRYHYVNLLFGDMVLPVVFGLKGSGHTASRQWMFIQNNSTIRNPKTGETVDLPAYYKKYKLGSVAKSDKTYSWFVPKFEDLPNKEGIIVSKQLRDRGKRLYDSLRTGELKAADESGVASTEEVDPREMPF